MPDDYDPSRYGRVVGDYDSLYPGVQATTDSAVDLLTELALTVAPHAVVEFGVGTGRLLLPIAAKGIDVAGIDGSEHMIEQLRAKESGTHIEVVLGDYRNTLVRRHGFSVAVLALNGIFDPRGLDAQLDIFRNVSRHLVSGGFFVVESWVMNEEERKGEWTMRPRFVGDRHVEIQLARFDLDSNRINRTLIHLRAGDTQFVEVTDTYAAPGELDVMAKVSGFRRVARYGSWDRAEFTATSANSISVFQLD